MRYLVWDKNNGKLIGIIGLTDPVFNLTPRDAWVGWDASERRERLVHTMDAFVLGALPPYSRILGGKLVALLATSSEVVKHFRAKYSNYKGIISEKKKNPRLVPVDNILCSWSIIDLQPLAYSRWYHIPYRY